MCLNLSSHVPAVHLNELRLLSVLMEVSHDFIVSWLAAISPRGHFVNSLPRSLQIYSLPAVSSELITCDWRPAALYTLLKWQPIRRWISVAVAGFSFRCRISKQEWRGSVGVKHLTRPMKCTKTKKSRFETELKIPRWDYFYTVKYSRIWAGISSARSMKRFWQTSCVFSQSQESFFISVSYHLNSG